MKPETIVRWHRKGFKYYWKRKSKSKPGRPPIRMELIHLIRRLSIDELALLGHTVAKSTIEKYMVRSRDREPSQTWKTFIKNHMGEMAACDFFVVPTVTFKVLYCFVVLELGRRKIVHVNVTEHPTAEWTARQIREAFPGGEEPRFLMRDRDAIYGWEFAQAIKLMEIEEVISAPRSPWQNPFVERVIGSIRREATDHIIPLGRRHLVRTLLEYVHYYNEDRAHQSLDGNSPFPRTMQRRGEIVSRPVLGGLHHRYSRVA